MIPWGGDTSPKVLGVPVHRPDSMEELGPHLRKAASKLDTALQAVSRLPDPQAAHGLLRKCVGPMKIEALLRALDLSATLPFAAIVDESQRRSFSMLVGSRLTDAAWAQACLPISQGGCGLTSAVQLAPAARLGGVLSFARFGPLIVGGDVSLTVRPRRDVKLLDTLASHLPPELQPLKEWRSNGCITTPSDASVNQKWWSAKMHQHSCYRWHSPSGQGTSPA